MTRQQAERMISYGAYCNCGGYSRTNDDNVNPHQSYCPHCKIWNEYTDAMFGITPNQWSKALWAVDKNIHPHTATDEQIKSAWEILKQKFSWLNNHIDK